MPKEKIGVGIDTIARGLAGSGGGGGGGSERVYRTTITGDGSSISFVINHNLNTMDAYVILYDANKEDCMCDITRTSGNSYTLEFEQAPASGTVYNVSIVAPGAGGGGGSVSIDNKTIIYDNQNKLQTAIGGWYDSVNSTYHPFDAHYAPIDNTTIKINPTDGKLYASCKTLNPMPSSWTGSNLTAADAAELMINDGAQAGEGYLATVYWSDLGELGMMCAEVKAFVISDWIVQFEMTSSDTSPYAWFFNSAGGVWRSYLPVINNVTSTDTKSALSAAMGKELNDRINNLQSLGRYLSVWNCVTGLPKTNPPGSLPYIYKSGDWFFVGTVAAGIQHTVNFSGTDLGSNSFSVQFVFTHSSGAIASVAELIEALSAEGYNDPNRLAATGSCGSGNVSYIAVSNNAIILTDSVGTQLGNIDTTCTTTISDTISGSETNYMPNGASYTGAASTTVCTDPIVTGMYFIYDNNVWTLQGGGGVAVQDVTDWNGNSFVINGTAMIPKSDNGVAGLVAMSNSNSTETDENGIIKAQVNTYSQYAAKGNNSFVGKGTLENVLNSETLRVDGTSQTISTENQASARETIGAAEKFILHVIE